MIGYMGAIGLMHKTYSILSTANSVSDKINDLIKRSELNVKDRLNFKALERRLYSMAEPISFLLIVKQNEEINDKKLSDQQKLKK